MTMNRWIMAGLAALIVAVAVMAAGGPADRVTICHIPPGNPGNAHTITINLNALPSHEAHGDFLGECDPSASSRVPQ
jgi:hypothetical protein